MDVSKYNTIVTTPQGGERDGLRWHSLPGGGVALLPRVQKVGPEKGNACPKTNMRVANMHLANIFQR